jgi:anti-sigma factor RsiW
MNHKQIQNHLSAFCDGHLPEDPMREVADHLRHCGECRSRVEYWRRTGSVFSGMVVDGQSENFVDRVMARLAEPERRAAPAFRVSFDLPKWVYPAMGYAFAVVLVFAAILAREPVLPIEANTETVLLTDIPEEAQWTFSGGVPDVNVLFEGEEL